VGREDVVAGHAYALELGATCSCGVLTLEYRPSGLFQEHRENAWQVRAATDALAARSIPRAPGALAGRSRGTMRFKMSCMTGSRSLTPKMSRLQAGPELLVVPSAVSNLNGCLTPLPKLSLLTSGPSG
jgi:hypothetical protein